MEERIRSKHGYENHNMICPLCSHENDVQEVIRLFEKTNNKYMVHIVCDGCFNRVVARKHKLGYFSLVEYIDYKKRRMIKNGWIQKRFYNGSKGQDSTRSCA